MNLYNKWTNMVTEFVKTKGEAVFWNEYKNVELKIYKDILGNKNFKFTSSISELSKKYDISEEFIVGFVDGISESLNTNIDIENITLEDKIDFDINVEELYFNMLDAKADYLFNLNEWSEILTEEKIREITSKWRSSKVVVNSVKIGRNELCTCGSGKKYKKCCGK
ncbi:SEC-C metal-binding domain-containing protein [Candidatus Arthromitus sp. SFB-rat-Yit]|uniref:SEC-C metal-binding domain-containing protein n=1 Tax=Candidatus Arthromitus sp. SFB-rat-Yit TaxID=1041504 RepID=UPI000227A845|nr:SEC-C metal-binding domain-containing protein [Candidatus Arthromitus sp. SFB-rat-Yit]BAK81884.1 SEC-C domain-containing protein domain-containing protein [Candidatus Arthromitus sp. SFB-rat-Yit]